MLEARTTVPLVVIISTVILFDIYLFSLNFMNANVFVMVHSWGLKS